MTHAEWMLENEKEGTLLVLIPEGEFLAGGYRGRGTSQPPFKVHLPAYYLGLHPVTNRQWSRYLMESRYKWREKVPMGRDDHPVVNVNYEDAEKYCRWAGLRLPSELEWEKGARGLDGRSYPWGSVCEDKRYRNSEYRGIEMMCGVWEYADGSSVFGNYQMSGNVYEWCADWYDGEAFKRYKRGDLGVPKKGSERVVRGGSWKSRPYDSLGRYTCYERDKGRDRDNDRGFRCAKTL